jgi:hypothetical protein
LFGSTGMAFGALNPTNLHIEYVADNHRCLLHLPTPRIFTGGNHGGERDGTRDFFTQPNGHSSETAEQWQSFRPVKRSMNSFPQGDRSHVRGTLQSLTERAQLLTGGDAAAIALQHQGSMICRASVGRNAPALGSQLDVSSGLSGECVRSRKALLCEDSDTDPRVDAETCRRFGIRSILVVPIAFHGEIVGLLEVFSSQRFAFHEGDLVVVKQLAESAVTTPSRVESVPGPHLLLEMEPRYRVFWGNLKDTVCPLRLVPLKLTSRPARFWPDVFVPSQLPWEGFGQSVLLQGLMLVALLALLKFESSHPRLVTQNTVRESDAIYYLPSEYAPVRSNEVAALHSKPTAALPNQTAISVRRGGSANTAQKSITPPKLELRGDLRLVRLIAARAALPAVPISATMRTQLTTPAFAIAAIAPQPEISGMARRTQPGPGTQTIVQPAPPFSESIRQRGMVSVGELQVVAPAPEVPGSEHGLTSIAMRNALASRESVVVPPAPSVNGVDRPGLRLGFPGSGGTQVVPPAPAVPIAGSYAKGALSGGPIAVVPPPPSVGGFGSTAALRDGSISGASTQVVPPVPTVQVTSTRAGGVLGDRVVMVVPPAPSAAGLGYGGGHYGSALSAAGADVVPPAPTVQASGRYGAGAAEGIGVAAVPPPPSASALANQGSQGVNSLRTAEMEIGLPTVGIQNGKQNSGAVTLASARPGGLLPGEIIADTARSLADAKELADPKFPDTKELNVNLIGPALVLPASSYFLSYEVFIAEVRLTRHQSRLIKLVYDFLPYQRRLSDYGPDYPAIENLRATRDPSCDESLSQVESSASSWPRRDQAQLSAKSTGQKQGSLPCYRTTADDYRKALARQRSNANRDR